MWLNTSRGVFIVRKIVAEGWRSPVRCTAFHHMSLSSRSASTLKDPCLRTRMEIGISALDIAKCLLQVIARYGVPACLRSDRGTEFTAKVVSELCSLLEIEQRFTLPYRPQGNSITERSNAEIIKHLKTLVSGRKFQARWSEMLPFVTRILNASINSSIGCAPATLLYGGRINLVRMLFSPPTQTQPGEKVITSEWATGVCQGARRVVQVKYRASDRSR